MCFLCFCIFFWGVYFYINADDNETAYNVFKGMFKEKNLWKPRHKWIDTAAWKNGFLIEHMTRLFVGNNIVIIFIEEFFSDPVFIG